MQRLTVLLGQSGSLPTAAIRSRPKPSSVQTVAQVPTEAPEALTRRHRSKQ